MYIILYLSVIFTQGNPYLTTEESFSQFKFQNTSVMKELYVSTDVSQATDVREQQVSLSGDGETLDVTSKSVDNHVHYSTTRISDALPDIISRRTGEYQDGTAMTTGRLATYGTTGHTLGSLGSTGSKVTDTWSYIQQTGPADFRVNIEACMASRKTETISASEGTVEVVVAKSGELNCTWNIVVPEGKFVTVAYDRYHSGDQLLCLQYYILLNIFDFDWRYAITYGCGVSGLLPPIAYSLTNKLVFFFDTIDWKTWIKDPLEIKFRFNTTVQNWRQNLLVVNTSLNSGYVASPGYDRVLEYPNYFNGSVTIIPPPGHTVMISFSRIDINCSSCCSLDYLRLTKVDGGGGETEVWKKCGSDNVLPQVFNSSLRLMFVSDYIYVKTGFKMLFSFHSYLETPKELDAGVFNCSVPYYHNFKDHLHCNLDRECQGGEDEVSCPYTTQSCGEGFIDAGNKCYRFENQTRRITWNKASTMCRSYGQQLVTLKTPQEWRDFQRILDYGKRSAHMYVGLLSPDTSDLELMYGDVLQWIDGTMAHYVQVDWPFHRYNEYICFILRFGYSVALSVVNCNDDYTVKPLCESPKNNTTKTPQKFSAYPVISNNDTLENRQYVSFVKCSNKQISMDFLSCAIESNCNVKNYISFCEIPSKGRVPMFKCDNLQTIPYSLVCDFRYNCVDGSDEKFCEFSGCKTYLCDNHQCVNMQDLCDGIQHCVDRSDEICSLKGKSIRSTLAPPAIVNLVSLTHLAFTPLKASESCPDTHFRCRDEDYCLPVFMRCNGVYDCLDKQDETNCETYTCPGLYRCYSSIICLHPSHVCDGVLQCPQQDDERFCQCPTNICRCQGLAFVCNSTFNVSKYPDIRYLDASGTGLAYESVENSVYLVSLTLRNCGLRTLSSVTLRNLQMLDLKHNLLTTIEMSVFIGLENLRYLILSGNPLSSLIPTQSTIFMNLMHIDLSLSNLETYDSERLINFPTIKYLNLSYSPIKVLVENAFSTTPLIQHLDLRGCPVKSFSQDVLKDLTSILVLYSDNYKLCCQEVLPEHLNQGSCFTVMDEISSCEDLLESNVYRIFLWVFCLLALVGNGGSFVSRFFLKNQASYSVFVINLNIADFVMGIYLAIIGVADQVYRGKYLWHDTTWKSSSMCHVAGFLCLLSTEVSAFIICLIMLDRFLVLQFPFSTVRFKKHSATVACCTAWVVGLVLAAVPLLPMTSHWDFYSQTGICVPLPITRKSFGGHDYSFGIVIILNFVLFVLIAIGQLIIYYTVRANSLSTSSNKNTADLSVARRLTSVVVSSFLCFFPVALLGVLAASGTPIPGEVNVAMAIFVLPFNAALNPFLYTFNTVMEKRRKAAEVRLLERLQSRVHSEGYSLHNIKQVKATDNREGRDDVIKQIKVWIQEKVLTFDIIMDMMNGLNKPNNITSLTDYLD